MARADVRVEMGLGEPREGARILDTGPHAHDGLAPFSAAVRGFVSDRRAEIAGEIRSLMARLGLDNAAEVARLLQNPGDRYPSPGLIRTYLGDYADPSDKFIRLLRARAQEVDEQIAEGLQALEIAGRLHAVYYVTPKRHLVSLLTPGQIDSALNRYAELPGLKEALHAGSGVPSGWLSRCEICGEPFIARTSRSRYCYRLDEKGRQICRREAARRRRIEKRKLQKANERAARKAARKGVKA